MTQLPADQEQWVECAPGSLLKYASQRRWRRRRRSGIRIAAATVAIAVGICVAWFANRNASTSEFNFGGIACHEVARLMPRYVAGELPAEQSEKIRLHLAQCPSCQEMMQRMRQQKAAGAVSSIEADCPDCHALLAALLNAAAYQPSGNP